MRYSACLRRETFRRRCQRNYYWCKFMTCSVYLCNICMVAYVVVFFIRKFYIFTMVIITGWNNVHYIWHHASPLFHYKQFQEIRSLESDLGMDIWSAHTFLWHAITLHALTSTTVCKVQVSGRVITFNCLCWYCSKCWFDYYMFNGSEPSVPFP